MAKHPGGRPIKWTPAKIAGLRQKFLDYLYAKKEDDPDEYVHPVPSVSEFAFLHHIRRQMIYEHSDFAEAIELCKMKRERDLEMGGLSGALNASVAIFGLKQLGWTDKATDSSEDFEKDKSVLEQLLR